MNTSSLSKRKRDQSFLDDEPESSSKRPKNDVFINYSFEDIGKTFISHLRSALIRNSFAISDHTMLPIGQNMHLELLKAIEESEMYVVVFSPGYASCRRCLDELVDIMDNFNKFDERKVVPVFYKVEPSDVRSQKGPFMEAFQAHHTNTNLDPHRVQEWRQALKDVSLLSGLTLQNRDEAEFVLKVGKELEKMQRPQDLHVTDHPVGIASRAEELISTLRLDQKDCVLVVAVFGISGIGKTTIVKEVFNRIAPSFDLSCFLADIHHICQVPNWKVKLPKALISCLTHENRFSIMSNHNEAVSKIRRLVCRRKFLLVLDDVDNFQQLESLGICPKWFYEGSRIIVTTRDKRSLGNIQYIPYDTMLLNRRESLNLFTRLMFVGDGHVNPKFIKEVVSRAGGIPLVLKVWSSHFKQYEREQWPSILETLKGIPHGDVQKQLQLSYDSLTPRLKKLFLDIVCFFNVAFDDGMNDMDLLVKVLEDKDSRFFPNNEIQYLVDKSLVEITSNNQFMMHRAIREMGLEIVRQENEDEPGQRTRLSDPRDVMRVLTECSGTEAVESISVAFLKDTHDVTLNAFRKMNNLRLIYVWFDGYAHSLSFHDETTHLCFKKLKYMHWFHFPFKSLDNFDMCNVVVLTLTESRLETLWEGIKSLKKLRILDVSRSYSLTKTGNLSGLEHLEEMYFQDCVNLKKLHRSIGDLQKLAILDLRSIRPLKRIPWEIMGKLTSLQKLFIGNVHGPIPKLDFEEVHEPLLYSLHKCPITELSLFGCNLLGGVVSLPWLKHLTLWDSNYSSHPDSLLQLHQLNTILFGYCSLIQSIPNLPGTLTSVKVFGCGSLVNLPSNITELKSLKVLNFKDCPKLGSEDPHFLMKVMGLKNLGVLKMEKCGVSHVPSEIGNLVLLKKLNLSSNPFSSFPDTLSNLSELLYLNIESCEQLRQLPVLPSNLTEINALKCRSLGAMSSVSKCTKVCKESLFDSEFTIILSREKNFPHWCSFHSTGHVLAFITPVHLANICGIILCANIYLDFYESDTSIVPKIYNKTKNTSHRFKPYTSRPSTSAALNNWTCVMFYPLDDTTLLVEPGDSMAVVLKVSQGSVLSCGLRLIYASDVVDCNLAIQTVTEPNPLGDSRQVSIQLNAICNNSHGSDDLFSDEEDYSRSDDEDELWYKHI